MQTAFFCSVNWPLGESTYRISLPSVGSFIPTVGNGIADAAAGTVLLARNADDCLGNNLGCATSRTIGVSLLVLGGLAVVAAVISQVIGVTRESTEVPPLLPDRYYYEPPAAVHPRPDP